MSLNEGTAIAKEVTLINQLSERVSEIFSRLSRMKTQLSTLTSRLDGSDTPEGPTPETADKPGELGTLDAHVRTVESILADLDTQIAILQKI